MEIKILQVFYGKDGLPYKDKDRQVHFPITGTGFLGASNTTKIKFYYDELDNLDETTWVAVSKLPNGKVGSRVLESYLDEELNEHYALLELDNYYTQYKGDVFISLQGYQGGVDFDYDEENSQYEIHGTPTIAATGSIKFTINYANQFVGSGETDNINFQRILAALGTKLGMREYSEHVEELPSEGSPDVFYVVNDDPNNPNLANIYVWNKNTSHYIWVGDNTLDLGEYYTKEQGEQFEEGIDNRVTSVENELSSVAQGSPKGVYATVSALESAYPTGTNGIFVVVETGNWYYWDGTQWTSGGVYQATQLLNGQITEIAKVKNLVDSINYFPSDILTGKYYTNTGGEVSNSSSQYLNAIDLSNYYGGELKIIASNNFGSGVSSSTRAICFKDANGNVSNAYLEKDLTPTLNESGCYEVNIPFKHDDKTLYFSISDSVNIISISINKNIVDEIDTVYVSTTGSNNNNGTKANPFRTIARAILSGKKHIKIKAGNYNESIILNDASGYRFTTYDLPDWDSSVQETPMIQLNGGTNKTIASGIVLNNCSDIVFENIWCMNTSSYGAEINNCSDIIMNNCKFTYTFRDGLALTNVNGTFNNCIAYNVGDQSLTNADGFNIHGYGSTTFNNCIAYNCLDDGISHHNGCTGFINGGEFYNCGKGGIATPTFGAIINITGAYCHNNKYGLYAVENDGQRNTPILITNCAFINNTDLDIICNKYTLNLLNCKYNNTGGNGTINNLNN